MNSDIYLYLFSSALQAKAASKGPKRQCFVRESRKRRAPGASRSETRIQ